MNLLSIFANSKNKNHKIVKKGINTLTEWLGAIGIILLPVAVIFILFGFAPAEKEISETVHDSTTCVYSLPKVPDSITFCGELVPVQYIDVYESLQKELIVNNYYHSQTLQIILRSGRYFPVIEKILQEYDLPDDLKYIAAAESALLNATSPAKAVGFWQILSVTAKEYGLEVNDEVDERYSIEKSTEFAAKYLQKAYEKYGSWAMAVASYNRGMTGIQRQINRQEKDVYYDLLLNSETARYVYRMIALKLILTNPQEYGFCITPAEYYHPYKTKEIKVNSSISSMSEFATEHHTNYKILKLLNPWLRETRLTNSRQKEYVIKVPHKKSGLIRE